MSYDPIQETASLIDRISQTIRANEEHLNRLRKQLRVSLKPHGLTHGMTLNQAKAALPGWSAVQKPLPDASDVLSMWDFQPPGTGSEPLRLTFGDGHLLLWGTPATENSD